MSGTDTLARAMSGLAIGRADSAYALQVANNAETRTYVARLSAAPPAVYITGYDNLITALKAGAISGTNIWATAIDALYMLAAPTAQAARLNLKGTLGGLATVASAPVFIPGRGYYFDGIDDALDLGFAPTGCTFFTQNSAFVAARGENPLEGQSTNLIGLSASNLVGLNARATTTNTIAGRINSGTAEAGAAVTNAQGLVAISRTGASATQMYKNAAASGAAGTSVSAALSGSNFCIAKGNGAFYTGQIQCAVIGGGLTANQEADVANAISAFLTAIGFASITYTESTRAIVSSTTLPDGAASSDASKGWTCTGGSLLPDGTFLVGNHGKATSGAASFLASIVHLNATKTQILHEWPLAAMAGVTNGSVQGVTHEYINSGGVLFNLYFAVTGVGAYKVPISTAYAAGAAVFLGNVTDINGISYDQNGNLALVCNTAGNALLRTVLKTDVTTAAAGGLGTFHLSNSSGADWDHVNYDAPSLSYHLTFGANGSNGRIYRYAYADAALYGAPFPREQITLTGALAIEAAVPNGDGTYTAFNDAYFHGVAPLLNQAIVF